MKPLEFDEDDVQIFSVEDSVAIAVAKQLNAYDSIMEQLEMAGRSRPDMENAVTLTIDHPSGIILWKVVRNKDETIWVVVLFRVGVPIDKVNAAVTAAATLDDDGDFMAEFKGKRVF